ncbi:MAG: penicillin acylase family protein [Chloroflexaceae bacterium]|nr:penicillin acylase family protein [Chloroflexaceae bacterium]
MRFFNMRLQQVFALLILLAFFLSAAGFAWQTPAQAADALTITGFDGPIMLARDQHGVPTIRASTENDAQFGLGYAHAQDRLWQMEWQRRLAHGRSAEFLGAAGLQFDSLFRTVGLSRAAQATWANLSERERMPLEAYVAGINAYLHQRPNNELPPEFSIFAMQPEPWTPVDVLAISKLFTWGNGSSWDKELLRAQLAQLLGPKRAAQLTPAYLADGPVTLQDKEARRPGESETGQPMDINDAMQSLIANRQSLIPALLALHRNVAEQTGIGADGRGSNAWVLSGARTTTGKPLLANDPHLASQTPAFWYLARLAYGEQRVFGATFPGGPGVQIGHNRFIAWGVTTINVDSQDLYIEQVNERNQALYQGIWEPLQVVTETIKVKGQPDVNLTVRSSRHGPLLSDLVHPAGPALAVRWTGHDGQDAGFLAALAINRARSWAEFTQVFRDYRAADQNYVYADQAGNIGYIAAGTIPIRPSGDGRMPVPGWTGAHEWQGYVPTERLPQRFNPPEGYLVSANNKVSHDDSYPISNSYAAPYRAARIVEMLNSGTKQRYSPDDMATMQGDVLAVHARRLMPTLLNTQPTDERSRQALALLRQWDFRTTGDSAATAIFEAWYIRIAQRLFADELIDSAGNDLWKDYSRQPYFVSMAMETALLENTAWCDDVDTPATESCADTLAAALNDGLTDMAKAQGSDDLAAWRWDKAHLAQFPHQPLGAHPDLGPVFNRAIPNGGDKHTVNVASSFRRWEDYNQLHAAQYRQIVDFSNLRHSRWIVAPGQGGDPHKPHYDDLLKRWQQLEYLPMGVR